MPKRHKRNLSAWLQNWVTEVESFTPPLGDVIVPVVIVDDQVHTAPVYGAHDRIQAFGKKDIPAPAVGQHATMEIRVRGEGMLVYAIYPNANVDIRITFSPDIIAGGVLNPSTVVPPMIQSPNPVGARETLESVFTSGDVPAVRVDAQFLRSDFGASPGLAVGMFPHPLPVPAGCNIYVFHNVAAQGMNLNFWMEEIQRR